jgi:FkbM family methyltransferase
LIEPKSKQEFENQKQRVFHSTSTQAALRKLALHGHVVETIVDIGASDGSWSKAAQRSWPESRALLIEANPHWRETLQKFTHEEAKAEYVLAAAGPADGGVALFHVPTDQFSGAVVAHETAGSFPVPQISVDEEIQRKCLHGPFLLKFDTHGFEAEILAGASATLTSADIIVMEMYLFQSAEKRFPAMCLLLEELGFRCVDVCELLYRDYDFSLWQFDAVFVRADAPELQVNVYAV